jgi:transposase-like protein
VSKHALHVKNKVFDVVRKGGGIHQAAREAGVHFDTARRWVKKAGVTSPEKPIFQPKVLRAGKHEWTSLSW